MVELEGIGFALTGTAIIFLTVIVFVFFVGDFLFDLVLSLGFFPVMIIFGLIMLFIGLIFYLVGK